MRPMQVVDENALQREATQRVSEGEQEQDNKALEVCSCSAVFCLYLRLDFTCLQVSECMWGTCVVLGPSLCLCFGSFSFFRLHLGH